MISRGRIMLELVKKSREEKPINSKMLLQENSDSGDDFSNDDVDQDSNYKPDEAESSGCQRPVFCELNSNNYPEVADPTKSNEKVNSDKTNNDESNRKRPRSPSNLSLLPICPQKCRKRCHSKLDMIDRNHILNDYKTLSFGERRLFYDKHILEAKVLTRTSALNPNKRNRTLKYTLPNTIVGEPSIEVCKTMFLHTLGRNTDSLITQHLRSKAQKGSVETLDKRGQTMIEKRKIFASITEERIKQFIESYQPVASHYNLQHAPNRRYLPPEITITFLYAEYNKKFEKVSYDTFRRVFHNQNIGFTTPSQDECPTCMKYKQHSIEAEHSSSKDTEGIENINTSEHAFHNKEDCKLCRDYQLHKNRYNTARKAYQDDSGKDWPEDINVYSADMQKILIIPKMPIKNSYFISRLVVMNETFACLHKGKNVYVLWHEAIIGRGAPEVTSTFYTLISRANPSVSSFIFWADNCSAQNKNWTLYTMFSAIVNEDWGPKTITLKYFEPGHSFMKCDSLHGLIGTKWKKQEFVLDMNDVIEVVKSADKKGEIISMAAQDFRSFKSGLRSRTKKSEGIDFIPLLENIRVAEFRKGSRNVFYKDDLNNESFKESRFLKKKFPIVIPEQLKNNTGINTLKLNKIKNVLLPHMPPRKRIFWNDLHANEASRDLCTFSEE